MLKARYDPLRQRLIILGEGRLTLEHFTEMVNGILISPPPECLRILSDYRQADFSAISSNDVAFLKSLILTRIEKYRQVKEAILVSGDLAFGLVRMYEAIYNANTYQIRNFYSLEDAARWLESPFSDH